MSGPAILTAGRIRLRSAGLAAGALLLLAVLTGCGHRQPAAPPVYGSATAPTLPPPARAPRRPPTPPVAAPLPAAPLPEDPIATLGRPTSVEEGLASWYGPPYHNRQAADGSVFDQNALTAAHRTLPMGSVVRVTNLQTGDSVVARITDRGPFVPGRTLDLSLAAAKAAGVWRAGVARVRVEAWAKPGADPAGRWCVQVGAFLDPADALQLKNDLLQRYAAQAKVIEFAGPTGHWVRINPTAADRATATRIAESIHIPDAEPYLVRLN